MSIEVNQIEPNPRVLNSQTSAPTTGPGKGSQVYPKDVGGVQEAHYTDDQGREIQLTSDGSAAGGGVSDHGALNGLGDDDHTQYHNDARGDARYFQQSEFINASAGIGDAGKPVVTNAAGVIDASMVTGGGGANISVEDEGSELTPAVTKFNFVGPGVTVTEPVANEVEVTIPGGGGGGGTPLDVQENGASVDSDVATFNIASDTIDVEQVAAGSIVVRNQEFSFNLPAGATMADRIASATGVPAGWVLAPGDTAGEGQFGALATTLVVTHGIAGGKVAQEISVFEVSSAGPTSTQGVAKVDLTSPGVQKTNTALTRFAVIDLQSVVNPTRDLIVYVKLI